MANRTNLGMCLQFLVGHPLKSSLWSLMELWVALSPRPTREDHCAEVSVLRHPLPCAHPTHRCHGHLTIGPFSEMGLRNKNLPGRTSWGRLVCPDERLLVWTFVLLSARHAGWDSRCGAFGASRTSGRQ